ncbi:hypothetical protein C1H46_016314 [Malus baccata]|uniref:Uncharacterized protein n=1 Tax=Malus baccata TaxID=106549 RepID=A0A540MHY1_MALBA|nr:hypothetical protein C1H46_016314 [Malus baccata]
MVEFLSQDYAEGISVQARLDSIATLHNLSRCHQIIPSLVSSGVVFSMLKLRHGSCCFFLRDCSNYGSRNKQSRNKFMG